MWRYLAALSLVVPCLLVARTYDCNSAGSHCTPGHCESYDGPSFKFNSTAKDAGSGTLTLGKTEYQISCGVRAGKVSLIAASHIGCTISIVEGGKPGMPLSKSGATDLSDLLEVSWEAPELGTPNSWGIDVGCVVVAN